MYFDSLQSLFFMDGHGVYVWPAYAVTVLVIVGLLVVPLRSRKRFLSQLKGEMKRGRGGPGEQ